MPCALYRLSRCHDRLFPYHDHLHLVAWERKIVHFYESPVLNQGVNLVGVEDWDIAGLEDASAVGEVTLLPNSTQ